MKFLHNVLLTSMLGITTLLPNSAQAFKHETAGDILQFVVPAMGLGTSLINDDIEGLKQFALHTGATLGTTYALKLGLNSTPLGVRPNGKSYSFPSGHTSMACSGVSYIGQRYGWSKGLIAMVPASYVGWSRIYANKHHTRDVLVGCAIGTLSGLLLVDPHNKINIQPWFENKTLGISLSSTW